MDGTTDDLSGLLVGGRMSSHIGQHEVGGGAVDKQHNKHMHDVCYDDDGPYRVNVFSTSMRCCV